MESEKRLTRHPFDGYPETREETDEHGRPRFRVTAKVLTPLRAKIADKLGEVTAAVGAAAGAMYIVDHNYPPITLAAAAGIWFGRPLFEKLWREGVRRKVEIILTEAEFSFRDWAGRWIVLDRDLQHSFALRFHDLAKQERDQHELQIVKAQQNKKIVQPRRYYQDSFHLVYELLRQRNDITEIYGAPEAQAVQRRLGAIDEVLKARAKRGHGTPLKPEDEWAVGPGVIGH
jgi:hypothetical protein